MFTSNGHSVVFRVMVVCIKKKKKIFERIEEQQVLLWCVNISVFARELCTNFRVERTVKNCTQHLYGLSDYFLDIIFRVYPNFSRKKKISRRKKWPRMYAITIEFVTNEIRYHGVIAINVHYSTNSHV